MSQIKFFQRQFPSANSTLLLGEHPILIDSGFGSDVEALIQWLKAQGIDPEALQMIANTHYHCDHVGGNHALQTRYNLPIAGHKWEAALINRRDKEACSAEWLNQPLEPYTVTHPLSADDILSTGSREWQVIHTPGHTQGHIAFYSDGVLIAGDTVHSDDVAWLNQFREGVGSIDRMLETIDKLATLPIRISYSGHGAPTENPMGQFDYARKRYEKWARNPHKVGWHALKRIFVYHLMLVDGLDQTGIEAYLADSAWYRDYCQYIFEEDPQDFTPKFLQELARSKAAHWHGGKLMPTAPYTPAPRAWMDSILPPKDWPR